jgi:hypothetical protein
LTKADPLLSILDLLATEARRDLSGIETLVELANIIGLVIHENPFALGLAKHCAEVFVIVVGKLVESRFTVVIGWV